MAEERPMRLVTTLFAVLLVAIFIVGIVDIGGRSWQVGRFPSMLSYLALSFALVDLGRRLWGWRGAFKAAPDDVAESTNAADLLSDRSVETGRGLLLAAGHFGILIGFIALMAVVSYLVATFVYIALFYRFIAKSSLLAALIAASAGSSLVYVLTQLLNLRWPESLFF